MRDYSVFISILLCLASPAISQGQPSRDICGDSITGVCNGKVGASMTVSSSAIDSDLDGIVDTSDNCTLTPNPDQIDADADGFGNLCDADLDNDCQVNTSDLGILKFVFFSDDDRADFNSDGVVNVVDLGILKSLFFMAPGPSGIPTICGPPLGDVTLRLLASNLQIPSHGQNSVTITALLSYNNGQPVPGQTVTFSADSGGLSTVQSTTDTSGVARTQLSSAGDATNRAILVTGTVDTPTGALISNVIVDVVGTQLSISGPAAVLQGETELYTVLLTDAAGGGIGGETVTVSSSLGNTLAATNLTTDFSGQAQVDYTAINGGTDTFLAVSLGETAATNISISSDDFTFVTPAANSEVALATPQALQVRWLQNNAPVVGQTITFSSTRGTLSDTSVVTSGSGEANVMIEATNSGFATVSASAADGPTTTLRLEFVATAPTSVEVQADPFTVSPNSQSTITAVVRDVDGNLVKNTPVTFNLTDITGGTLSVGTAVTDSQGRAQTFYTSSTTTSAQDGVRIEARIAGGVTDAVTLTVAGREVFFTFGTGNEIFEPNSAQYRKEFVVQVTDADGRPVAGVTVSMSVVSQSYSKGFYWPNAADDLWSRRVRVSCNDEDINRNGDLDPGEDFNGSGSIEAGNVASVAPGSFDTDSDGFGLVDLFYPQEFGGWVEVQLEARASVQGTEFSERAFFNLTVLADDVNDLETSPPARLVTADNLDENGLVGTPAGIAIGVPGGSPYNLLASPFGYNADCSQWEVEN